jgi:hypothetical protein
VFFLPEGLEDVGAPGDAILQGSRSDKPVMQPAKQPLKQTQPYPLPTEASRQFGTALHDAVKESLETMEDLRACLKPCVAFLRDAGVGPVQMILTIKASAKESALRNHALGDEFAVANANLLMDQIVKWAIVEYYRNA